MSNQSDRRSPFGQGSAIASLVAAVACTFASDALASQSPARPDERELAARVAAIVERIRLVDPALVRNVPPEMKIAQWRNR